MRLVKSHQKALRISLLFHHHKTSYQMKTLSNKSIYESETLTPQNIHSMPLIRNRDDNLILSRIKSKKDFVPIITSTQSKQISNKMFFFSFQKSINQIRTNLKP